MKKNTVNTIKLLRDELIPNILENDTADILYWAGKTLLKNRNFNNDEELNEFFNQVGFGNLKLIKQKQDTLTYFLSGESVINRLKNKTEPEFMLETGFLAKAIEKRWAIAAEGQYKIKKDGVEIQITGSPNTPPSPLA